MKNAKKCQKVKTALRETRNYIKLHKTWKNNSALLKIKSQDFFGDSEAHARAISTYAVKTKRFYVLGRNMPKKAKNS